MLNMYCNGYTEFMSTMAEYNVEVVSPFSDALNTLIVPFGINELGRYVSDNKVEAGA